MTISYLSYTTSDHPPNYQSFITILIFGKKVAHYMILLKLLSWKASFCTSKKAWYTYELRSDNSFTPVLFNRSMRYPSFFQQVGGYENIEIVERIHLKFLKPMYILNIKSRTPCHIWFLIMENRKVYIICPYLF